MTAHDEILRLADACALAGIGKNTLYRMLGEGKFPAALELSPGRVGWLKSEVIHWRDNRPRRRTATMKRNGING